MLHVAQGGTANSNDFGPACDFGFSGGNLQVTVFGSQVSDSVFESADAKTIIPGLGTEAFYDGNWHRIRAKTASGRVQVACTCALPAAQELTLLKAATSRVLTHLP